jgi:hypothetical protein
VWEASKERRKVGASGPRKLCVLARRFAYAENWNYERVSLPSSWDAGIRGVTEVLNVWGHVDAAAEWNCLVEGWWTALYA